MNSNYEYVPKENGEDAERAKPVDQHSWKFSRNHVNSPFQKMKFFDENSFFNSKLNKQNCSQQKGTANAQPVHFASNPFLCDLPFQVGISKRVFELEKRSHQKFCLKRSKNSVKAKKNSLIVPKTNKIFLSQISNSERESKIQANLAYFDHLRTKGRLEPKSDLFRQRQSLPQILSSKSRNVDSTVPDNFHNKKKALEILKKIDSLNKEIPCNNDFRDQINRLINNFDRETPT